MVYSGVSGRQTSVTKVLNFSYYLGLGALIPFLPVYFRLLGINAFQTGIIGSVRWIIASWSCSLWSSFAEKCHRRKTILFLSVVLGLAFNFSLAFVGERKALDEDVYHCDTNNRNDSALITDVGNIGWNSTSQILVKTENADNSSKVNQTIINQNSFTDSSILQEKQNKSSLRNHSIVARSFSEESVVLNRRKSQNTNQTVLKSKDSPFRDNMLWKYPNGTFEFSSTSITLLVLIIIGSFVSSAAPDLIDTITTDIVQQCMGNYGVYPILRILGTTLSAIIVGLIIDNFKCEMLFYDSFDFHFCTYAAFSVVAVFTVLFMDIPPSKDTSRRASFCQTIYLMFKSFHTLVFMVSLVFIGTLESLVSNFLFWYMMDIGGSVTTMCLVIIMNTLPEVLIFFKAGQITNLVGHSWILLGTLLSYTLRLVYFSYINNPWLIPVIEILHGFIKPLMLNACKSYSVFIAPYGMEGTFQTIFTSLYQSLGLGLGGIATSLLYQLYGPVVVFRCTAGLCGVFCILFAVLQCVLELPDRNQMDLLDYEQVQQQDAKDQGDWLLEALNADDDEVTHFSK